MLFNKHVIVRNIENKNDWEIVDTQINLKTLMAEEPEEIFNFLSSLFMIWIAICFFFGSILGFIFLIKNYF